MSKSEICSSAPSSLKFFLNTQNSFSSQISTKKKFNVAKNWRTKCQIKHWKMSYVLWRGLSTVFSVFFSKTKKNSHFLTLHWTSFFLTGKSIKIKKSQSQITWSFCRWVVNLFFVFSRCKQFNYFAAHFVFCPRRINCVFRCIFQIYCERKELMLHRLIYDFNSPSPKWISFLFT